MVSTEIVFERSFYIGLVIGFILYGLELYICFQSIYYLYTRRTTHKINKGLYIAFSSALLLFYTISAATNAVLGQLMWIEHRDIPGGPPAYLAENVTSWWQTLGTVLITTGGVLSDTLLLYRCLVVWDMRLGIVAFPFLIYMGSVVMSILMIVESIAPHSNLLKGSTMNFEVPFLSLCVSFNVIITILISSRLLMMRRQIMEVMGEEGAKPYTNIIAILVESAMPFTVLGILSIVFVARRSPMEIAFLQVWSAFCVLSPQLIILRVAMGEAWSRENVGRLSDKIEFAETPLSIVSKSESAGPGSTDSAEGDNSTRDVCELGTVFDSTSSVI